MKRRVLALLLCVLMVLPLMLASCEFGGGNDPDITTKPEEEDIYVKPATLNFHIISEKPVSADDEKAIEDAFNAISKKLYKTQIDFIFYTADEYDEKILQVLKDADAIGGTSAATKFENSEVVTSLNDVNIPIETYPEIENNQVDIVLINSKELYETLRGKNDANKTDAKPKNYLAEISNALDTKFTDIEQRVNSHLINGALEGKKMYAVPNNVLIGQYEFVLVNKELAYQASYLQKEDFLTDKAIDYSALRKFAAEVQAIKAAKDVTGGEYVGLYSTMLETLNAKLSEKEREENPITEIFTMQSSFDYPTVTFFPKATTVVNNDVPKITYPETIFGVIYPFNATLGSTVKLDNVFADTNYAEHRKLMLEAGSNGYYPTSAPTENVAYAIRYATGNFVDIAKFEAQGYIVLEADTPRLNSDDAFNAMFAVTNYSASTDRALEIIQAIVAGTDEEEVALRNILQYGVENTHYTKDDDTNEVTRKNQNYLMNANYTGNLVTAYPCEQDGRGNAFLGYFTEQNKDATLNPLHGITADDLWARTRTAMINYYSTKKILAAMIAEFMDEEKYNDLYINTMLADIQCSAEATDASKKADERRAALVAGAKAVEVFSFYPAADYNEAYNRLLQYWYDVRSSINPMAEKTDATPATPNEVKSAVADEIKLIKDDAEKAADAYIADVVALSETLWAEAEACETVEALEAFIAKLDAIKSTADPTTLDEEALAIYTLLYSKNSTAEFYGMLHSGGSASLVYPSTLKDALAAWYYDYVNGR